MGSACSGDDTRGSKYEQPNPAPLLTGPNSPDTRTDSRRVRDGDGARAVKIQPAVLITTNIGKGSHQQRQQQGTTDGNSIVDLDSLRRSTDSPLPDTTAEEAVLHETPTVQPSPRAVEGMAQTLAAVDIAVQPSASASSSEKRSSTSSKSKGNQPATSLNTAINADEISPSPTHAQQLEKSKTATLRSSIFGECLDTEQLTYLSSLCDIKKWTKIGARIFEQDQPAECMYIVHKGEVLIELTDDAMDNRMNQIQVAKLFNDDTRQLVPLTDEEGKPIGASQQQSRRGAPTVSITAADATTLKATPSGSPHAPSRPALNHPASMLPTGFGLSAPPMPQSSPTSTRSSVFTSGGGNSGGLFSSNGHRKSGPLTRAELMAIEAATRVEQESAMCPLPNGVVLHHRGKSNNVAPNSINPASIPLPSPSPPLQSHQSPHRTPKSTTHTLGVMNVSGSPPSQKSHLQFPLTATSSTGAASRDLTKVDITTLSDTELDSLLTSSSSLLSSVPPLNRSTSIHTLFISTKTSTECFGHAGMLFRNSHRYMYSAVNNSISLHLLILTRKNIDLFWTKYPDTRGPLLKHLGESLEEGFAKTEWSQDGTVIEQSNKLPLLTSLFTHTTIEAGVTLFEEGAIASDSSLVYYLLSGTMEVTFSNAKGHKDSRVVGPGVIFGEFPALLGFSRPATCKTTSKCVMRTCMRRTINLYAMCLPKLLPHLRSLLSTAYYIREEQYLEHPTIQAVFTELCLKEFNAENIEFYARAVAFRKVLFPKFAKRNMELVMEEAALIYNRYISETSVLQINIKQVVRSTIKSALHANDITKELFRNAEREICQLMLQDSFTRFKNTPGFKDALNRVRAPLPLPILLNYNNAEILKQQEYAIAEGGGRSPSQSNRACDNTTTQEGNNPSSSQPSSGVCEPSVTIPLMFGGGKRTGSSFIKPKYQVLLPQSVNEKERMVEASDDEEESGSDGSTAKQPAEGLIDAAEAKQADTAKEPSKSKSRSSHSTSKPPPEPSKSRSRKSATSTTKDEQPIIQEERAVAVPTVIAPSPDAVY